ncbi:MAG: hypothetical protein AAF806_05900 [Bacteroidota bacterium]
MAHLLSREHLIWANDIEFAPLRAIQKEIQFPDNGQFIHRELSKIEQLTKFDVIIALDVLEHMSGQEIEQYYHYFMRLLQPKKSVSQS